MRRNKIIKSIRKEKLKNHLLSTLDYCEKHPKGVVVFFLCIGILYCFYCIGSAISNADTNNFYAFIR